MSLDIWLLVVHILGAMVWVGGGVMLTLIGVRARSSSDPNAMGEFARVVPYVGPRVLGPAVVVLLVTGVLMVLRSAAWNFSQVWVLLALGLFVLAFVIGAIYLSRVGIEMARVAGGDGVAIAKGAALLNRWLLGYGAILLLLLVAVWDMVFKPGL
jgi:uncharacterized membrane protein